MLDLRIHLDGDGVWPDLKDRDIIHLKDVGTIEIAALSRGMTSGRPSIAFRLSLPDGKVVFAETSLRLFLAAARALAARYGWQDDSES